MFDTQVAPAFLKCYYEYYLTDPCRLEAMYTQVATFSHADVQPFIPGGTNVASNGYVKGLEDIRGVLQKIKHQISSTANIPRMKVCFAHLDTMPSAGQTITILAGGYFLFPDGASRFVHNFVLQSTAVKNNYLIVSDVLRIYPKQGTDGVVDCASKGNQGVVYQNYTDPRAAPHNDRAQEPSYSGKERGSVAVNSTHKASSTRGNDGRSCTSGSKAGDATTNQASKATPEATKSRAAHASHGAHHIPVVRDWGELMDEAVEATELQKRVETHSNEASAGSKQAVSSYAAAVRKAASANAAKPAQKVGGVGVVAPENADDADARVPAPGRGNGKNDRGAVEDNGEGKRGGNIRNNFNPLQDGKPHEKKGVFIKYCAILKNLPLPYTDEEIVTLLAPFVKVTSVRNGTALHRTYAFVKFDDENMIETIQENTLMLRGSKVDIERVVEKYAQQRHHQAGELGPDRQMNRRSAREGENNNNFNHQRSNPTTRTGPYNRSFEATRDNAAQE